MRASRTMHHDPILRDACLQHAPQHEGLLNLAAAVTDPADVLNCRKINRRLHTGHVMRSMLSATAMILLASAAHAQAPAPSAPVKPKPVTTVPVRPAVQTPADAATTP